MCLTAEKNLGCSGEVACVCAQLLVMHSKQNVRPIKAIIYSVITSGVYSSLMFIG